MNRKAPSVDEEWRDVRGWVPWLVAGVYFPIYVVLDYAAGGPVATLFGMPRSVSVALFSLSIALFVTAVVTVTKLDSVSLSRAVDVVHPRRQPRGRRKSSVGSGGAVNRRTVESSQHRASTDSLDEGTAVQKERSTGLGSAGENGEDWPEEWIPGDKL